MEQIEHIAWNEQLRFWEDMREVAVIQKEYWELKLKLLKEEETRDRNKRRGW